MRVEGVFRQSTALACTTVLAAALGLLAVAFGPLESFAREPGKDKITAYLREGPITVYTYRPTGCEKPSLLFVFHGLGRNASSYRNSARELADRKCMIVFAPLFDRERFPTWRYQRGGIVQDQKLLRKEQWTVSLVAELVAWARLEEGMPSAPYYLFGHSAGGQFLSRVAAFDPPRDAAQIVIANPSTYVLPSTSEPVPFGLGRVFGPTEGERQLSTYLDLPITIYLGDDDTGDEDLSQFPEAVRQGGNRLERGRFVFDSAKSMARANGRNFRWRMVTASDVGHTARGMLQADEAIKAFGLDEPATVH
jgi:pimeloyl-ACP methyl ester carboxylesterase